MQPGDMDEFKRQLERTFELDRLVRSHIIYEAIAIEGIIDNIISTHFCTDEAKHVWFQSLIFREGEITFSKKITILKKLLRSSYPHIFALVPGITNKLDDIRNLRNKFAHSELVLDEEKLAEAGDKGIFLRYIKDGKVVEEFIAKELADKVCNDNNVFKVLMFCIFIEVKNRGNTEKKSDSLLELIKQLTEKIPGVLERVK